MGVCQQLDGDNPTQGNDTWWEFPLLPVLSSSPIYLAASDKNRRVPKVFF